MLTRREVLRGLGAGGGAGLLALRPRSADAEPPPETTRIRLAATSTLCFAPQFVAEELLRAEGFGEVQYVNRKVEVASGPLLPQSDRPLRRGSRTGGAAPRAGCRQAVGVHRAGRPRAALRALA
jgi:hypothetical protein